MTTITNTDDTIDIRDVIERFEELRDSCDENFNAEEYEEFHRLKSLLEECKGKGGDEKWEGDWYPGILIHESYFTDYAQELCEECGDVSGDLPFYIVVDWEATAKNIQQDYTCIDFDGETYWTR